MAKCLCGKAENLGQLTPDFLIRQSDILLGVEITEACCRRDKAAEKDADRMQQCLDEGHLVDLPEGTIAYPDDVGCKELVYSEGAFRKDVEGKELARGGVIGPPNPEAARYLISECVRKKSDVNYIQRWMSETQSKTLIVYLNIGFNVYHGEFLNLFDDLGLQLGPYEMIFILSSGARELVRFDRQGSEFETRI